jgi:serine/threonine protein phosphatase PrpC
MSEATAAGSDAVLHCPTCGADVRAGDSFCEACGTSLAFVDPTDATGAPVPDALGGSDDLLESPISLSRSLVVSEDTSDTVPVTARRCTDCGGLVGADGYCEICGSKAPSERDHYTEQPASWVAACCDRGIRHHRNEDASAVAAEPEPRSRAVLVVCDGVSTSTDSDVAALAAARMARDVLQAHRPAGLGLPESRAAAAASALSAAVRAANDAVVASTAAESSNAASCTLAAAVVDGSEVTFGNVGDSRVYWIPDRGEGEPRVLTLDDSVAQLRIDSGIMREEAEAGPQAHAITKWLGRDSPDCAPTTGTIQLTTSGWVLACTDGLWNYASEPADLQALITDLTQAVGGPDPLPLAEALVSWACDQGGKDNITVALARH